MNDSWPVAAFDPVRRLRALAAGVSGATVAERVIPVPFDVNCEEIFAEFLHRV